MYRPALKMLSINTRPKPKHRPRQTKARTAGRQEPCRVMHYSCVYAGQCAAWTRGAVNKYKYTNKPYSVPYRTGVVCRIDHDDCLPRLLHRPLSVLHLLSFSSSPGGLILSVSPSWPSWPCCSPPPLPLSAPLSYSSAYTVLAVLLTTPPFPSPHRTSARCCFALSSSFPRSLSLRLFLRLSVSQSLSLIHSSNQQSNSLSSVSRLLTYRSIDKRRRTYLPQSTSPPLNHCNLLIIVLLSLSLSHSLWISVCRNKHRILPLHLIGHRRTTKSSSRAQRPQPFSSQ